MLHLERTRFFLRKIIREYYKKKPLEEPSDLHKREIAIESLEDNVYIRHLSFPYMSELYKFITTRKTPLHLYYSSALYAMPDASRMEDKMWEGSELLFDIDSDKYEGCVEKLWICLASNQVSQAELQVCSDGSKPFEYSHIPWRCIEKAWNDALKIIDILKGDLGYERIKIYFSGNRGFHIKVSDPNVLPLDRDSRRLIADYISCEELDINRMFPTYRGRIVFSSMEYGLRRRIKELAIKHNIIKKGNVAGLRDIEYIEQKFLNELLHESCIKIDKIVTMDISRLSRFNGGLNMKSGLRVVELNPTKDINNYSYEKFSPFNGGIKVKSLVTTELNVFDNKINLVKGEKYKLDAHIGIYLVLKGIVIPEDTSELGVLFD